MKSQRIDTEKVNLIGEDTKIVIDEGSKPNYFINNSFKSQI